MGESSALPLVAGALCHLGFYMVRVDFKVMVRVFWCGVVWGAYPQSVCYLQSMTVSYPPVGRSTTWHCRGRFSTLLMKICYIYIQQTVLSAKNAIIPKWLTVIHTYINTLMAVAAMQGTDQHIRSSFGVQYLAQGHFAMQTRRIVPATFRYQDAVLYPWATVAPIRCDLSAEMFTNKIIFLNVICDLFRHVCWLSFSLSDSKCAVTLKKCGIALRLTIVEYTTTKYITQL